MVINIAALQMPVEWGNETSNIKKALEAIDMLEKGSIHIICLAELFTTGFDYEYLEKRDQRLTRKILDKLSEIAKEKGVYILAGTLPAMEKGRIYNTVFVIDPSGRQQADVYRKIHLFPLMDEDRFFSPGENLLVFNTTWAKIGTAVCYDLRFPELFQSMALKGAKVIFVPAQFPASRIEHWDTLLKARAIENQLFIVGVNIIGKNPADTFSGHTCIYDPMGKLIAGGGEREGWIIGSIDLSEIDRVRRQLPALFCGKK